MNVQTRHHRGESSARLVHAEELGNGVAQGLDAVALAEKRDLRHRVAQHAGSDRVALGMVGIQEAFRGCPVDHLGQFHPRFTASCTPVLRPSPPTGLWTSAASPASSTRRSR